MQVFHSKEMSEQESLFSIDGNVIDNVKEFVYIGKVFFGRATDFKSNC